MLKVISFVIPCYNSYNTIGTVVDEIVSTVKSRKGYDYQIILVNDNSPDKVIEKITEICASDKNIIGLDLAKNFGQHAALMAGFRFVTGDYVICLDDDGQTPAKELYSFIDAIDNGSDLVFAKYITKKHSVFRNLGSFVNELMARYLLKKPKNLSIMSYFACRKFVIDEIIKYENPYPYMGGLLLSTTQKITNIPISHRERQNGSSGYTFKKLISLWLNGFTAFSIKPLRIATVGGFAFSLFGFIYLVYIIINKLFINPNAPTGYSSTMATLLLIGGGITLALGMIGEYIGRIYISINKSPQYVIRDKLNVQGDKIDKQDQ